MSSLPLAFSASPIDFNKNERLQNKLNDVKKRKLHRDFLDSFKGDDIKSKNELNVSGIEEIHKNIQEDNENELHNFYESEMKSNQERKKQVNQYEMDKKNSKNDYLIMDNQEPINNIEKYSYYKNNPTSSKNEMLEKLNYLIDQFEDQKEIKSNQKNEEIVLYSFLGIFIIYVLDSFVCIGKYSRD